MCLSMRGPGIPTSTSSDQGGWYTVKGALPLPLHYSFSSFLLPHCSDSSQHHYAAFVCFPSSGFPTLHWPIWTLTSSPTLPPTKGDSCYKLVKRQVGIQSSTSCGTEIRGVSLSILSLNYIKIPLTFLANVILNQVERSPPHLPPGQSFVVARKRSSLWQRVLVAWSRATSYLLSYSWFCGS